MRSDTHLFADDLETNRDMRSQARSWIAGDPGTALSVLMDLARGRLRKPIYVDDIVRHLRANGLQARNLARDERLRPCVESLQRQFVESLQSQLAGGRLIERPETQIVLENLLDDRAPRLVVLHGTAGIGKSGVLYELTTRLDELEVPYLPLRLDRQRPVGSVQNYSDELKLLASPAAHLHALAGDRPGALILDQFDALRWTSAHASNAWAVGQEMIREALASNLQVVVCCRTFDLENDPQIRSWKQGQEELKQIAIGDLTDDRVRRAIEDRGGAYDPLTPRQRMLLRNVLHLKIWIDILVTGDAPPQFESQRELMRAFWENRLQQLDREGVSENEAHALLDRLVEWMDQRASLTAPRSLLRRHSKPAKALQSLGVLQLSDNTVTFAHQSYLDSLLAERLVEKIEADESTVLEWLGKRAQQSLFRREQLRLVLGVLRDESRPQYLTGLRQLLDSEPVRFHLKQLALQFLGQLERPSTQEIDLISQLLGQDSWREHLLAETVFGHGPWFEALDDLDVWATWLTEEDEALRDQALLALRSVSETCGDRVARLLAPYEQSDEEWSLRCVRVLSSKAARDSDGLFALRLRLIEADLATDYISWKDFGSSDLARLCELLFALLLRWTAQVSGRASATRYWQRQSKWHGLEDVDLRDADAKELLFAWLRLVPATALVLKAARRVGAGDSPILAAGSLDSRELDPILSLLSSIGHQLAEDNWQILSTEGKFDTPLAQLLIMEALRSAPQDVEELADWALSWLMERPERLRLRYRYTDSPWAVSGEVIERFAACCSESAFRRFETFLMRFQEPKLLEDYRFRHEQFMKTGLRKAHLEYPSSFGVTQYHLLPHLLTGSATRAKSKTNQGKCSEGASRLQRILTRKFRGLSTGFFYANFGTGDGHTRPSRTPESLERLSDQRWIDIISSSQRSFSVKLGTVTARQPERFARLALRLPATVDASYFQSLLQSLQITGPPNTLPADRQSSWSPASGDVLGQVLLLPKIHEDPKLARPMAWVVHNHAQNDWPPEVIADLLYHARHHADPRPGTLNLGDGWDADNIDDNTWNSTRSVVGYTIASVLFAHQDDGILAALTPGIEALIDDPHPVVRVASTAVCRAAFGINAEQAMNWFFKACDITTNYPAMLACRDVRRFVNRARWDHFERMQPMLLRMIGSETEEVAQAGAEHVTHCSLTQGLAEDLLRSCLEGTPAQRRGIAEVAADWLSESRFHAPCKRLLKLLAEDTDEKVLGLVSQCFYRCNLSLFEPQDDFMVAFARSQAFKRDPSLLHSLEMYEGPLTPFADCILQAGRTFAEHLAPASRDGRTGIAGDTHYLAPLMLRLYEQSSRDPEYEAIHQECLDVWDQLIENRVGMALELTSALDKV
ncbi:MAG: hypothetical protein GY725_19390 [bacterium]|nr:hypothetical protein [bacterium]